MFTFTYKAQRPKDFGAYVIRRPAVPAPELRGDWVTISGRDGSFLDTDWTYENIEIDIELNFIRQSADQYAARFRELKNWLIPVEPDSILYFSDDVDMAYMVKAASMPEIERVARRGGRATASFICDPYTYYMNGLSEMTLSAARNNPGSVIAWPIFIVEATGSGTVNLMVNGETFAFPVTSGRNELDTERGIAVNASGIVVNGQTTGDLSQLFLSPGTNSISSSGSSGLTYTAKAIPRWRTL